MVEIALNLEITLGRSFWQYWGFQSTNMAHVPTYLDFQSMNMVYIPIYLD